MTVGVTGLAPKVTPVAVARPIPLIVTVLLPAKGPEVGPSEDLNGAPTWNTEPGC